MRKKFAAISVFMLICVMLCSCFSEESSISDSKTENNDTNSTFTFPLKENGYPDTNYITVNGDPYSTQVRNRDTNPAEVIEVCVENKSDNVIIVLPQCVNILKWVVEEVDESLELVESRMYLADSNSEYNKEGDSPYLCEFTFAVTNPEQLGKIVFKLVNVDSSIDPDGYYTLTISLIENHKSRGRGPDKLSVHSSSPAFVVSTCSSIRRTAFYANFLLAASTTWPTSTDVVTLPTPPGTGVIASTIGSTSS